MTQEQKLYDAFVDTLLEKVQDGSASPKDLEIVLNFLKYNNISATSKHEGVSALTKAAMNLPFEDDNIIPLREAK